MCDLGAEVYASLGDYRAIMPGWVEHPGVSGFVDVDEQGERQGFILVGFYDPQEGGKASLIADLLAIAVAPAHQRKGVGRRLLGYAVDFALEATKQVPIAEIRLTVADTNAPARALFAEFGFAEIPGQQLGRYDRGQVAMRMRKWLGG